MTNRATTVWWVNRSSIIIRLQLLLTILCLLNAPVILSAREANTQDDVLSKVTIGLLAHDPGRLWSWTRREDGVVFHVDLVFNSLNFPLYSGTIRPNAGWNISSTGATSSIFGGCLWERTFENGLYISTGIGLALHDGELGYDKSDRKALGSRVLLRIPFEIGYRLTNKYGVSFFYEHKSNGFLFEDNEGLDEIGIRISYFY